MRYVICVAAAIPLLTACGEGKPPEPAAPPPAMVVPDAAAPPLSSPPPAAPVAMPESAPAPVASPDSAAATAGTYVVVAGDTLFRIARKHSVNPKDLARWNGIKDPRRLRVGQKLTLAAP